MMSVLCRLRFSSTKQFQLATRVCSTTDIPVKKSSVKERKFSEQEMATQKLYRKQSIAAVKRDVTFGTTFPTKKTKAKKKSIKLSSINVPVEQDYASYGQIDIPEPTDDLKPPDIDTKISKAIKSTSSVTKNSKRTKAAKSIPKPLEYQQITSSTEESDIFGTLAENSASSSTESLHISSLTSSPLVEEEEEDNDGFEPSDRPLRLSRDNRRHEPNWYVVLMKRLAKEGKIKEALEVFYHDVLVRDRVLPDRFMINQLLAILAGSGLSEAALKVFRKSRELGIEPNLATYSMLFKACAIDAQSAARLQLPNGEINPALEVIYKRTLYLWNKMEEEKTEMNRVVFNSLIQALGETGYLQEALRALDAMKAQPLRPDHITLSCLLRACSKDTAIGSSIAIHLWRVFFTSVRRLRASPEHYVLLLRTLSHCNIGDLSMALTGSTPSSTSRVLGQKASPVALLGTEQRTSPSINDQDESLASLKRVLAAQMADQILSNDQDGDKHKEKQLENTAVQLKALDSTTQDIFAKTSQLPLDDDLSYSLSMTSPINLLDTSTSLSLPHTIHPRLPWQRLSLVGGLSGLLEHMVTHSVSPSIRHFTALIDLLPPTKQAEQALLLSMTKLKVKPDITFFNILIKRRGLNLQSADDLLATISDHGLSPNLLTFSCLAFGCHTKPSAKRLLEDIDKFGFVPNQPVMATLLKAAGQNWMAVEFVLAEIEQREVVVNTRLLAMVEEQLALFRTSVLKVEAGQTSGKEMADKAYMQAGYKRFLGFYKNWLHRVKIDSQSIDSRNKEFRVNSKQAY